MDVILTICHTLHVSLVDCAPVERVYGLRIIGGLG